MNPDNKKYILENMGKKPPVKKAVILASIALVIILGFAVYANSLSGKFVYDDQDLVENNTLIKEWPVSLKIFTAVFAQGSCEKSLFYRPLQRITYAIDYHIWKLNVVGYHLTSILLHILVALCVYWLISILFKDRTISALTAVFFAVHPIHTGVVNYISSRADSLYLFFMLVSFIFYIKSLKAKGVICCIIMVSSYSLALLSKENSLILPVLILLYHYTFREKIRLREFLSISGVASIYILLRMTVLKYLITGVISNNTLLQRIPGFFAAVATYVRLIFLPFGLHMEYGVPLFNFTDPKAICGLGILAALIFCAFKAIKTNRLIFFSLSWFLITLIPISNLYPINAYMAENWLYLPSIGIFLVLAGILREFYKKEKSRIFAITLTACLIAFYSYLTIRQNETWREPISFYERTLRYAPGSPRIYNNLGVVYHGMGKEEDAITMYKKVLEIKPDHVDSYNNLGVAYYGMGKKEEAIAMYKKTLEIKPDYAEAYNNLGVAYYGMGKKEEAIAMCKKAIEIKPDFAEAYNNLGGAYYGMGKKEDAIAMHKKAIEINPDFADAYNNLANRYNETGRKEDAIAMYKKAIEINPNYVDAYNSLGLTYCRLGKKEEAIAMWKKAIEINPDYAETYNNLASIYDETGRKDEAIAMYKKAIEINPDFAEPYNNLGVAYCKMMKEEGAIAMYKKAIEINPNYADAYNNLGGAYFTMGRKEDAAAAFKKALEINPAQADARRNLDLVNDKPK